jgi:invasin D
MIISTSPSPAIIPLEDAGMATQSTPIEEASAVVNSPQPTLRLLDRTVSALNRAQAQSSETGLDMGSARAQLRNQRLQQCANMLPLCRETLTESQRQRLDDRQSGILHDLKSNVLPGVIAGADDTGPKSSNDFFDKLLDLIGLIKNGYLDVYQHIIEAYSAFFTDFNKNLTAKMKDWIEGANEGKEIKLNVGELRAALNGMLDEYKPPKSVLFPMPGKEGASREEAQKWKDALGLPDSCLVKNEDGTYSVVMDLSPLHTMLLNLPEGGTVTWDTARFQAWQTGFNAQEERMKNMLQSYMQKYSNANSYHDNFNKTLSSHLNQYSDMLKAMLNF